MLKRLIITTILLVTLLSCFGYMTIDDDVFLTILIDKDKSVQLDIEGSVYLNGEEYSANKVIVSYINNEKIKIKIGRHTFKGEPNLFELSIPKRFYRKGEKKHSFSGNINIRTYKNQIVLLNVMNLESYTRYVVSSEIGSGAPLEALKAQAIISRTYAIYMSIKNSSFPWDLRADTYSQVFNTKKKIPQSIIDATDATEYNIITSNGKVAFTPFSGNNGGMIADVKNVWGGTTFPYLKVKSDCKELNRKDMSKSANVKRWIKRDPTKAYKYYDKLPNWLKDSFRWQKKVSYSSIAKRGKYDKITGVKVVSRTKSGRVNSLRIITTKGWKKITSQDKMRRVLGVSSTIFYLENGSSGVVIKGKGNGHGVGFCQTGAYLKSYEGWNYNKLIKHYFPKCKIDSDFFFSTSNEDALDNLFSN